ncbi:hypothetical protein FSP39_023006 [Pinctada imbricata]|uniref:CHCH domain-containing protein n=1 Tax=Pinctada imbricata TaxID=66713 RepID=A0AA88Y3S2_PINIB|nr:hypothetical protein FSP39_023006 [Pinctada imbricata]
MAALLPRQNVSGPDKGSFPLDHEGLCKLEMRKYMKCLYEGGRDHMKCRTEARGYFQCRMDNKLMDKEEWSKLGFHDQVGDSPNISKSHS